MKLATFHWALALLSTLVVSVSAGAWEARHLLDSAGYQQKFNELVAKGYRLNYVTGYTVNNSPRFAAIWEKRPTAAWVARHGLTSTGYQNAFNAYTSQGYRPVLVNGYTVSNSDRYVAIWDKSPGTGAWVARHGLTGAQYQSAFNTFIAQGFRLRHVSGYAVAGQARYAAIWEKPAASEAGVAWVARHGLTSAQYQAEVNRLVPQGYRIVGVSGYGVNGVDYYAALFEKKGTTPWMARHGLNSAQYQAEFNRVTPLGYKPTVVNGYTVGTTDRYAAIWERV